ncbi:MAG: hypothetical protein WBM69_15245 [Desulfobacterales bacterium]
MLFKLLRNRLTIGFFLLVFLTGCTSLGQVQKHEVKPVAPEELPPGNGWWRVRFRMNWPPDTDPVWHMDLYLAHQVILPLLEKNKNEIHLWRFHRRASRDRTGRQFTFYFYSTPRTAQQIYDALQSNPILINTLSAGVIDDIVYDNPANIKRPNIDDTSDKTWPLLIQKTWPYYINGVSQMWLNLVAEIAARDLQDDHPASIEDIESFYRQVDETVTELWQENGRHAFLHHLNAVFGYEPLIYWEKRFMDF